MQVLIDSSIWIDYFRGDNHSNRMDFLIDENLILTNDLILTELIPFLKVRKQIKIIHLLNKVSKLELNIDWQQIIHFQSDCLQNGINGVGIPDLIIVQNAIQNSSAIYSLDNHFKLMKNIIGFTLLEN